MREDVAEKGQGTKLPRIDDDGGVGGRRPGERDTNTKTLGINLEPKDTLAVIEGVDSGRVFEITGETTWIGRDATCEIKLNDPGVSRRHAVLVRARGALLLRDNDAKNGTFVNGRGVSGEYELRRGDEIQLGPSVNLLYTSAIDPDQRIEQQRAAREQIIAERMYLARVESFAAIVAAVAHELNTPLGVASTATAMIGDLAAEMARAEGPPSAELLADLRRSLELVQSNLERTGALVARFRQLSASHLTDDHVTCDLGVLVRDAVETMSVETAKREIEIRHSWEGTEEFPWAGFPGHMNQIVLGLMQNALRYAFKPGAGGRIDLRLSSSGPDEYRFEFEDYGAGITAEFRPRIFEPFVTSGRDQRAMGLGLPIIQNIVRNILHGDIFCSSIVGEGTRFVVKVPRVVPQRPAARDAP